MPSAREPVVPRDTGPALAGGVRRIRIVGNSGSGKTTLARALAARLGVAHLELDAIHHEPGWQEATDEDFRARIEAFLAGAPEGWVIDGNYRRRLAGAELGEELTVWLDLPRRVVMPRVVRRTLGRAALRRELWHGNRESFRSLLRRDPRENIVLWSWTQHGAYREQHAASLAAARRGTWLRLHSRRDVRAFLATLP